MEILHVVEHGEIDVPLDRLMAGGQFALDPRIAESGYFTVALSTGKLRLRSSRFVGLIPLTPEIAVRVLPKASIANLTRMMVRAACFPEVIENFSRGYRPVFVASDNVIELYFLPYLTVLERLQKLGLPKRYIHIADPPKWRGRLMVADTVKRYAARGIHYRAVFDFTSLSQDTLENRLLKKALSDVVTWLTESGNKEYRSQIPRAKALLSDFAGVADLTASFERSIREVPSLGLNLRPQLVDYRQALWTAYVILQQAIPDLIEEGYVTLESMIIDVSQVFENYVRAVISDAMADAGITTRDGNVHPRPFFSTGDTYRVQPDIILEREGAIKAVVDVKYKPRISEQDRYELLAFMEATGAKYAAFICPMVSETDESMFLGTTLGGRSMGIIRMDLAAGDLLAAERQMTTSVMKLAEGRCDFVE